MAVIGCSNEPAPEHKHQWGEWTQTKAPTNTEDGEETKTCSTCGEKETRPIDKLTHTHQFGTAWVKNATQHWHECSCGEKADIANHTWDWVVTTPATPTADGVETRTCSICGEEETRSIEQTEPTKKEFTVNFLFQNPGAAEAPYQATVIDSRTNCGSQNLEQIEMNGKSIVTIIEEAIQGAFDNKATTNANRNTFRNVFGIEGGVTIYVENPTTTYKMKATNIKSIYFHIDYLNSSPADIQQNCFDAVTAIDTNALPFNAE
jgi:hypothetical protein